MNRRLVGASLLSTAALLAAMLDVTLSRAQPVVEPAPGDAAPALPPPDPCDPVPDPQDVCRTPFIDLNDTPAAPAGNGGVQGDTIFMVVPPGGNGDAALAGGAGPQGGVAVRVTPMTAGVASDFVPQTQDGGSLGIAQAIQSLSQAPPEAQAAYGDLIARIAEGRETAEWILQVVTRSKNDLATLPDRLDLFKSGAVQQELKAALTTAVLDCQRDRRTRLHALDGLAEMGRLAKSYADAASEDRRQLKRIDHNQQQLIDEACAEIVRLGNTVIPPVVATLRGISNALLEDASREHVELLIEFAKQQRLALERLLRALCKVRAEVRELLDESKPRGLEDLQSEAETVISDVVLTLSQLLSDPDLRHPAAAALASLGPYAKAPLLAAVNHPDRIVRHIAVKAFIDLGDFRTLNQLAQSHPDPTVRHAAVKGIYDVATALASRPLQTAATLKEVVIILRDLAAGTLCPTDAFVRHIAAQALADIERTKRASESPTAIPAAIVFLNPEFPVIPGELLLRNVQPPAPPNDCARPALH